MVHYHFKDRYQSAQEALLALLPLASLYASTRGEIFDSTSIFKFAPPTLPPEADTHLISGENKISPLLLDEQTSKFTIPETLLSPTNFYQTTQNDEGLQIQNPSFRQSDNPNFHLHHRC